MAEQTDTYAAHAAAPTREHVLSGHHRSEPHLRWRRSAGARLALSSLGILCDRRRRSLYPRTIVLQSRAGMDARVVQLTRNAQGGLATGMNAIAAYPYVACCQ